ncbi:hypothetical protein FB451DRAFT_1453017 [Mycena latifolia]|nr:hypothetical protein FB451DRAFT_1453017 [Mycena latifolia]
MSPQSTVTDIRLNNTITCLAPVITLLNELSDAFGTPFVPAISNTTLSLITAMQNVKRNKEDCIQLLENVYQLLCAIVNLHIKSETKGNLAPATLHHVGKFMETLHKIHTFVEVQQDGSRIKSFFHQTETKTLLSECRAGLQEAFEVFKTETTITALGHITQMQEEAEIMHKEIYETDGSQNSSNSFSMLPAKPKIFYGRETELQDIVEILHQEMPRIAILGAGGMGKTSLAKATLHHPDIASKYEQCFFVPADSVMTSTGLSVLIAEHIGLKPAKDVTTQVLHYFATHGPSLLILDNLETSWEPLKSRGEITMRGAERPAKVQWTRPFLAPLKPLSDVAARDTFFAIAEDEHDSKDVDEILLTWKAAALLSWLVGSAKDLLSLLSILPDGLSIVELVQTTIHNIMTCKATLLATSLAYMDDKRRLKSLVPIREHMQCFCPPSPLLIHPLQKYFHQLLDLYQQYPRTQQGAGRVKHLALNARNISELLLRGLNQDNPNLADTINCTLSMKLFTGNMASGYYHLIPMLMDQIEAVLPGNCDEKFKTQLISWKFESNSPCLATGVDIWITQAISHFHNFNDPALESILAKFYLEVGLYYFHAESKISLALEYLHKAVDLAKLHGDIRQEALVLYRLGEIKWYIGDYAAGQKHAQASYRVAELAGDLHSQSIALRTSALCFKSCGDIQNSIFLCQRAQKLLELCGTTTGPPYIALLYDLAEAQFLKSEYVEARNIHMQLARDAATQDPYNHAFSLLNIAQLDIIVGASKQDVLSNLDKAKVLFNAYRYGYYGVIFAKIYCNIILGQLHLREGEILSAKGILQTCFKSTWGNYAHAALSCMESFANIKGWPESDFHWSSGWAVVYLGFAKKLGDRIALHQALQFLGDVFQAEGDNATSATLFTVALEGFTWIDIHHSRAECMLRLGDLAQGQGDVSTAIELWKSAKPLFQRSSQAKQVTQIDERLTCNHQQYVPEEAYKGIQAGEMEGERGDKGLEHGRRHPAAHMVYIWSDCELNELKVRAEGLGNSSVPMPRPCRAILQKSPTLFEYSVVTLGFDSGVDISLMNLLQERPQKGQVSISVAGTDFSTGLMNEAEAHTGSAGAPKTRLAGEYGRASVYNTGEIEAEVARQCTLNWFPKEAPGGMSESIKARVLRSAVEYMDIKCASQHKYRRSLDRAATHESLIGLNPGTKFEYEVGQNQEGIEVKFVRDGPRQRVE